jgi:hypothetical protein
MAAWNDPSDAGFKDHLLKNSVIKELFKPQEVEKCFDDSAHFRYVKETFSRLGL